MTKTKLTVARIVLAAILIVSLVALCTVSVAFADEAAAPQTREFNENYDRMLNDMSGADATPAYRHVVWEAGVANSVTSPIYKIGSPSLAKFDSITYVVRSADTKLENLKLGFRHSDHDKDDDVAIVNLAEYADLITFSSGSDIGSDWTEMTLQVSQWDGIAFVCGDDLNPGDTVSNGNVTGLHLFSDGTAGSLDIQRVEIETPGRQIIVLQNFSDKSDMWWDDSAAGTYTIFGRHAEVSSSKQITSEVATSNNMDEAYDAIVLTMSGSGTVTVAPVTASGAGTAKAWSALTDLNGTALPALGATPVSYVISLDSLGAKAIKGVEIAVTGGTVRVYGAFFTNLEEPVPGDYPLLDIGSINYMTQFSFEYLSIGGDYDKAVADSAEFNMDYVLSYGDENAHVKVTDGHLVFDNPDVYVNAKIRSKVASENARYLVVKYKLQNGATLNYFRFAVINADTDAGSGVVYANQMKAAVDKPTWSSESPYFSESGYSYLVIDLALTFGDTNIAGLDMYYSGDGQLLIDEIFYANKVVPEQKLSDNLLETDVELNIEAGEGYQYLTGFPLDGKAHDGFAITLKGSEGATLKDIRLQFMNGEVGIATRWFAVNAEGSLYDVYGNLFPDVTAESQTYIIDFAASDIPAGATWLHIHASKGVAATITVEAACYVDYKMTISDEALPDDFAGKEITAENTDYIYAGYVPGATRTGYDYAILEVEGNIAQLRIAFDGAIRWISENAEGTLLGMNGEKFATSGKQTLVIDLNKSEIPATVEAIHFHYNAESAGDVLKITSLKFATYGFPSFEDVLGDIPVNDDSKPVIDTFDVPATGTVGSEITITVSASDTYTSAAALVTEITVTLNGEPVTLSGNKFTPSAEGTYTVTVKVTDEAGNVATASKTIVVSKSGSNEPGGNTPGGNTPGGNEPGDKDEPNGGFPIWAIIVIVVAVLAIAGCVVFIVLKKKKGN